MTTARRRPVPDGELGIEYVSSVDGHRHFGDVDRIKCPVCGLEAERDRLRAAVDAFLRVADEARAT